MFHSQRCCFFFKRNGLILPLLIQYLANRFSRRHNGRSMSVRSMSVKKVSKWAVTKWNTNVQSRQQKH